MTVSALLAAQGQGPAFVRYLWEPLCIAALNTPVHKASAQVFLNVLRDALGASREAGDILLARVDLTALFPEPAAAYVRARGGEVVTGRTIDAIERQTAGVLLRSRDGDVHYDHAICAVSPPRAAALLARLPELAATTSMLDGFHYQPIYSVYLQFEGSIRLPAPMLGLEGIAQWVFDREALCGQRGLIGAVISAEGAHEELTQKALAREVHAQLERELGSFPVLSWHRVIAEKRATFECTVGLQRPGTRTALPNIHLAGDYTASEYPATLECAVRSGIAAAQQALESR
jgi:squalene-associated FAD-dependent desaturase